MRLTSGFIGETVVSHVNLRRDVRDLLFQASAENTIPSRYRLQSRSLSQKGYKGSDFVDIFGSHLESYVLERFPCTERCSSFITPQSPLCPHFSLLMQILGRNWSYQYGTTSVSWVSDIIFISRFYQLCFHFVKKTEQNKTGKGHTLLLV